MSKDADGYQFSVLSMHKRFESDIFRSAHAQYGKSLTRGRPCPSI